MEFREENVRVNLCFVCFSIFLCFYWTQYKYSNFSVFFPNSRYLLAEVCAKGLLHFKTSLKTVFIYWYFRTPTSIIVSICCDNIVIISNAIVYGTFCSCTYWSQTVLKLFCLLFLVCLHLSVTSGPIFMSVPLPSTAKCTVLIIDSNKQWVRTPSLSWHIT